MGTPTAPTQTPTSISEKRGGPPAANAGVSLARPYNPQQLLAYLEELAALASESHVAWAFNLARTHLMHIVTVLNYAEQLRNTINVSRILDVGAVPGFISVTVGQQGDVVEAIDLDPSRTQRIFDKGNVRTHAVNIEEQSFPCNSGAFDLVLFNEVIEHLRINPFLPLKEIHRVLRPGGYMVLSTPNISLSMRLRFVLGKDFNDDLIKEFEKLETVGHMGHFRLYSRNELIAILKHIGFAVERAEAHTVTTVRKSFKRRIFEKILPNQMGDHIYVLAKKA